jgi:hypothetical protein
LSGSERLDLYRFLSELGKPGPYDASKGSVARLWKVQPQIADPAQPGDEQFVNTPLSEPAWTPVRSFVDGHVPGSDLKDALRVVDGKNPAALFAAVQLQAAKSGLVQLRWAGVTDCPLWVDGKLTDRTSQLELSAGLHTIIVKLDAKKLPDAIRLECADATFVTN